MYLLYVDESGDTGIRGSDHLVLAGAALFDGKWRWIRGGLEKLLEKFFPLAADRPRELHSAEVRIKISQIRTLATERIGRRIGRASAEELARAIEGLNEIVGG